MSGLECVRKGYCGRRGPVPAGHLRGQRRVVAHSGQLWHRAALAAAAARRGPSDRAAANRCRGNHRQCAGTGRHLQWTVAADARQNAGGQSSHGPGYGDECVAAGRPEGRGGAGGDRGRSDGGRIGGAVVSAETPCRFAVGR
uniref:(northern house mosquito) hypothetical protein n=1 Tax=Culex pipiens TaxID=7175 RepID=A0A8D8DQ76_CULPI